MNSKRLISILLLIVFTVLSLRNLLPADALAEHDCQEFGHIHYYHLEQKSPEGDLAHKETSCSEAKYLMSYSPFPAAVFVDPTIVFETVFDLVLNIENHFTSPYLEPNRKPPKAV